MNRIHTLLRSVQRTTTRAQAWALAVLVLAPTAMAAPAPDMAALIAAADSFRTGQSHMQIETEVTVLKRDGQVDKERRYTVLVQGPRQSLVLMRSPAEAGQKVLMLGDDFWLLLPSSQRPVRITASQKLLGDASTGDIATLNWADDYQGAWVGDEDCDGRPCQHLTLTATRKGVSYQRIELWLGAVRHEPLKADLYLQSDKLAKQAQFVYDKPGSSKQVSAMVLQDRLSTHKETRVRYLSRQAKTVPEAWLNPMFLARNPDLE